MNDSFLILERIYDVASTGKEVREEGLDQRSTLAQKRVRLPLLGHAFARAHPFQSIPLDQGDALEVLGG
jgi:hypothetical protein